MARDKIAIYGARQHNLKDISLEIPRGMVIAVTGVSGSGKSSLAFDTIYAEGQRRYLESLSTYARQFIEKLDRPDIDGISGISPAIAIRQRNSVTSARSTVGTATEIYDYLRLLFARVGRTVCPDCGVTVRSFTPSDVAGESIRIFGGRRIHILMPEGLIDVDAWDSRKSYLMSRGYARAVVDGDVVMLGEFDPSGKTGATIFILLDRVEAVSSNRTRIAEAVELAYRERDGMVEIAAVGGDERYRFSQAPSCSLCGRNFETPSALLFSFNSPYGACPDCRGFGDRMEFSEKMIVPDMSKSLEGRAVDPWSRERFEVFHYKMLDYCRRKGIPAGVPWRELPGAARRAVLEGDGDYIGVIPFLEKMKEKSYKKGHRFFTRRYMDFTTCRTCGGTRLRKEAGYVKFDGVTIGKMAAMIPSELIRIMENARLGDTERAISGDLISELLSRLRFLGDVGLGYLTLDRLTRTLSGGEAQRINLANSLGANLVDTLYVLDEPSIGLHAADNERLIQVMQRLGKLGNTVMVVEHDPDIILSADHVVDLGPGAGRDGGRVMFNGSAAEAREAPAGISRTLDTVFAKERNLRVSSRGRKPSGRILLKGVARHNLKNIDVEIPLGTLTCVTGVSGSGKSTLVIDVIHDALAGKPGAQANAFARGIEVEGRIDRVLLVDQSPIGSSPRSNPITYIKGFSFIRELFASQRKSLARGYENGRFSFNKPGGRCAKCQGMGFRRVEMHFMADVFVPCEDCGGKRYNRETLEIEYKGKNISEILDLTVDEAIMFFDEAPMLGERLWMLAKTGLGYITLGQPSNTLSGGEAQRIKIARELTESSGQKNLYIMDEPTTGLHMADVAKFLGVLGELVSSGHSVLVIEHNMEVIAMADHIIDLGPGGGDEGGRVIACGHPSEIVKSKESKTGRYLESYIARYRQEA